jgi:hypothetical protein
MPSRNEAYRIMHCQGHSTKNPQSRVNFHGVNYGYAGDPVLLGETARTLLIKKLPTRDWSGLGATSYYGPQLAVALKIPGSQKESKRAHGGKEEMIVVVWDRDYNRTTRKVTYEEAQKVIKEHDAMPEDKMWEIIKAAGSFHASVIDELEEIKKRAKP